MTLAAELLYWRDVALYNVGRRFAPTAFRVHVLLVGMMYRAERRMDALPPNRSPRIISRATDAPLFVDGAAWEKRTHFLRRIALAFHVRVATPWRRLMETLRGTDDPSPSCVHLHRRAEFDSF